MGGKMEYIDKVNAEYRISIKGYNFKEIVANIFTREMAIKNINRAIAMLGGNTDFDVAINALTDKRFWLAQEILILKLELEDATII